MIATNKGITKWLAALLLAPMLVACGQDETETSATAPETTVARTTTLKTLELPMHYVTSGTVTSDHRVAISSRLSGYIGELPVREGDMVKVGQLLVRVDPVSVRQQVVQAEADLANAKADFDRYSDLYAAHAVSKQQLDQVSLRYKVARSQVAQAKNQLSYAEVRAPVAGVVVEKRMNKGDLASPGAPILVIDDPKSLLVETYVSEQFVGNIEVGDTADVRVAAQQDSVAGTVRQVVQAADAVSHQFLVKVSLDHASGIHSGMYAQIGFRVGKRQGLMIPAAAVIDRAGLNGIYLVDDKGIAHYRQIRLGEHEGEMVEVLAGLRDGDVIAWNGTPELKAGMQVRAQ